MYPYNLGEKYDQDDYNELEINAHNPENHPEKQLESWSGFGMPGSTPISGHESYPGYGFGPGTKPEPYPEQGFGPGVKKPEPYPGPGYGPGMKPDPYPGPGFGPSPGIKPEPYPGPGLDPGRPPEYDHGHDRHPGRDERPSGGPPARIPERNASLFAVDPGSIRSCLYSYVYVWLNSGGSFWLYPTFVGRKSISGYRWSRFGWVYTGLDLDMIDTFICIPR